MNIRVIIQQRLSVLKRTPLQAFGKTVQCLLVVFFLTAVLPACRVKSGCAASQKGYTNTMEKGRKRGKTALFPKAMAKKIKH
jgi:hypothetical protein